MIRTSVFIGLGKMAHEAKKEQGILAGSLASCQKRIRAMEQTISEYYHLVHERERERRFLVDCLRSGNTKTALEHLKRDDDDAYPPMVFTGMPCLDLFLTRWAEEMKKERILFSVSVQVISLPIPEGALYLLLDNLLENAKEAAMRCRSSRWVRMRWVQRGDMHQIVMENACTRMPVIRNGHIPSDKPGRNHGWGLRTVAEIVKRYGGEENLRADGERFSVSIVFWNDG